MKKIFETIYPTHNAATAALNLWLKSDDRKKAIEDQKEHIMLLKQDVLEERKHSDTVYCGWGTTVEAAVDELWWLESVKYTVECNGIGYTIEYCID